MLPAPPKRKKSEKKKGNSSNVTKTSSIVRSFFGLQQVDQPLELGKGGSSVTGTQLFSNRSGGRKLAVNRGTGVVGGKHRGAKCGVRLGPRSKKKNFRESRVWGDSNLSKPTRPKLLGVENDNFPSEIRSKTRMSGGGPRGEK